jgi:hypothetical protein
VGSDRNFANFLIIFAIVVCVAGVLILPQVDLPDFVLNGSKVLAAPIVHAKTISSCSISHSSFDILNSTLRPKRPHRSGRFAEAAHAFFAPDTLVLLRC